VKVFLSLVVFMSSLLFSAPLKIAVAANVSYAIEPLKREYMKQHPKTDLKIILGSSGKLTAQIVHGAPYDVFLSANMSYPQKLYTLKLASKPIVYAEGSLALLSMKRQDFSETLAVLKTTNIKKIAVANPRTAPYGIATKEALEKANLYKELKHKFVYGESISQTVSYTMTAADIGFIAKSALFTPKMNLYKEGIHWIEVDRNLYTPIEQGAVVLHSSKYMQEAKSFLSFLSSKEAKKIFKNHGYIIK